METAKRYLKKFLKLIGTGEKQRWMMRIEAVLGFIADDSRVTLTPNPNEQSLH